MEKGKLSEGLSMMKIDFREFTENNIQFRVISSKLLERYKGAQSFVLSEMIHGKFKFSRTAREIAILAMDTTFAWLIQLENYLIRDESNIFDKNAVDFAINTMNEVDSYIVSLVETRSDVFDHKIATPWRMIRISQVDLVEKVIRSTEELRDIEAFSTIANVIIEMIDTLKFQLYEIDYLVNGGKKPFLCLTDLCLLSVSEFDSFPMLNRAKVYESYFGINDGFYFKNYSQEMNPIMYVRLLEEGGVPIVNKTGILVP